MWKKTSLHGHPDVVFLVFTQDNKCFLVHNIWMPTHGQDGEANSDEGQRQCLLQEGRTGKGPLAPRLLKQGTRHVLREAGGSADYLWWQKMHCPTVRTRRGEGALRKGKEARAAGITHQPGAGLSLKITTTTKWRPAMLGDSTKRHARNSF